MSTLSGEDHWYVEPAEIQRDLDSFPRCYNEERTHQGYRLRGRTPAQALRDALGRDDLPSFVPQAEEEEIQTSDAA